jgi:hypothetical protein
MKGLRAMAGVLLLLGAAYGQTNRLDPIGTGISPSLLGKRQAAVLLPALSQTEEFAALAAKVRSVPPDAPEAQTVMEKALKMLDQSAISALQAGGASTLQLANQILNGYVAQEHPAGEGYRLYQVGHGPDVFALGGNFGPNGPSAVRLYSQIERREPYRLVAQIDRFTQKDYFDGYLELIPIDSSSVVFATVTGRTDELQSGAFVLWRYDTKGIAALWSSDLLPRSQYEATPEGLLITYCADLDEENPKICKRTVREKYLWSEHGWTRASQEELLPRH